MSGGTTSSEGGGAYGQGFSALPVGAPNIKQNKPAYIAGVKNDAQYMTNIGLVTAGNDAALELSAVDKDTGAEIDSWLYALNGNVSVVRNILKLWRNGHERYFKIETIVGSVWAYASMVEKSTGVRSLSRRSRVIGHSRHIRVWGNPHLYFWYGCHGRGDTGTRRHGRMTAIWSPRLRSPRPRVSGGRGAILVNSLNGSSSPRSNLTKHYRLYASRSTAAGVVTPSPRHQTFAALGSLLEIQQGETVGLIGQNGAGKSTH